MNEAAVSLDRSLVRSLKYRSIKAEVLNLPDIDETRFFGCFQWFISYTKSDGSFWLLKT
jgi:hypothetical protein